MKPLTRFAVLISLICLTASAFGQDLSMYRKMGTLTPHTATVGKGDVGSMLIYKRQGVMFQVFRTGSPVMGASVFSASSPLPTSVRPNGVGDVVPGVGAEGITLGMSRDEVVKSPFLFGGKMMEDESDRITFLLKEHRMLHMGMSSGKVSQIDIMGSFKTIEGITQKSNIADIERVYGAPDVYLDLRVQHNPLVAMLSFFLMPLLGLATGFYLRWARSRMAETSGRLAWMAAFGGVGLGVTDLAAGLGFCTLIGSSPDYRTMPYTVATAALAGVGSVLVLETLSERVRGCLGALLTSVLMALAVILAETLVILVEPARLRAPGMIGAWFLHVPFVLCMFLTAGRPNKA